MSFNIISSDHLIEKYDVDLYPITLVKFLMNKRRILSYFTKAAKDDFEIRGPKYKVENGNCSECDKRRSESKESSELICRQHTSIGRILSAEKVLMDIDTNLFFYKNEIFKMVGNKLVIVYCPHPRLIQGEITDSKVRRVRPITIEDPELKALPAYEKVQFISGDILDKNIKCWFNSDFSLLTVPEDRNQTSWCLISNK